MLSNKHREYKSLLEFEVARQRLDAEHLVDRLLKVSIVYNHPFFTKKEKRPKKIDIDNRAKTLLDSVFAILGLDDSMIFELNQRKVQSEQSSVDIFLEPL